MDQGVEQGELVSRKRSREGSSSPSPSLPLFEISTEPDPFFNEPHKRGPYISYTYLEPSSSNPDAILSILGEPDEVVPATTSSRCCFNCSSQDHTSVNCPEPKNQKLISTNRLKFQSENPQTTDGGKLGGDDNERIKSLGYAELHKAGEVSAELRYALGFGTAEREEEIVDYPWFSRFLDYGYPLGWTMKEGGQDPFEAVKDRIGREVNFDDVELLKTFIDADEEGDLPLNLPTFPDTPLESTETPLPTTASPPLPSYLPPLPPPDPPPPLPSQPPPPLPPKRLINYPTTLFNSDLLSIHQPGYLLPRIESNFQSTPQRYPTNFRRFVPTPSFNSPRSIPLPPSSPSHSSIATPPIKRQRLEREESESEMEMDISSGEED